MSVLQAKGRHLEFVDSQYGGHLDNEALVRQIAELVDQVKPELVLAPLGLVHPDHEAVRDALLEAGAQDGIIEVRREKQSGPHASPVVASSS
jgi:LmbE family N-acetylglucosaminyl deacetylase